MQLVLNMPVMNISKNNLEAFNLLFLRNNPCKQVTYVHCWWAGWEETINHYVGLGLIPSSSPPPFLSLTSNLRATPHLDRGWVFCRGRDGAFLPMFFYFFHSLLIWLSCFRYTVNSWRSEVPLCHIVPWMLETLGVGWKIPRKGSGKLASCQLSRGAPKISGKPWCGS